MLTHEKLETAIIALRHIADGGEGASYHIAMNALKEIEGDDAMRNDPVTRIEEIEEDDEEGEGESCENCGKPTFCKAPICEDCDEGGLRDQ